MTIEIDQSQSKLQYNDYSIHISTFPPQCAPGIFNLNQKFQGLSCFWGNDIHETVQNQSRKTSVIWLPKFTSVNMARKWHQ